MRLSDIKSAVILSVYLSVRPATDISATVLPIGLKYCTMVDLGQVFSILEYF